MPATAPKRTTPAKRQPGMEIACDRERLLVALSIAGTAIPTRTPMDILYCVRISADGDGVVVETTDCEIGMRIAVDGSEVTATGEAIVLFSKLKTLVSLLDDDSVRIWQTGSTIQVECGNSVVHLPCVTAEKFPLINDCEGGLSVSATASEVARCLRRTMSVCGIWGSLATDNVLFSLAIGLVNVYGTNCNIVSWDGFQADITGNRPSGTILVTQKGCKALLAALDESPGDVVLRITDSSIAVLGPRYATTRMASGSWPMVFTQKFGREAVEFTVMSETFERALKQAEVTTGIDTSFAAFELSNGLMTISTAGASEGESQIELPISWDRGPARFSLRPAAILSFLRMRSKGDSVVVRVPGDGPDIEEAIGFECGTHKFLASVKEKR